MARLEPTVQRTVQQVAESLIERIADGQWRKTSPLPDLAIVAQDLETDVETVGRALEQLHAEKLISRGRGGQFTVTDVQADALAVRFSNLVALDGARVSGEVVSASMEETKASPAEAHRLHVPDGSAICRIRRTRAHRGENFMIEVAALPLAVFPGLMDSGRVPFRTPVLCKRYGLSVRQAEEHVSLGVAGADIAVALGVGYGTPVFVLERVLYAADGTPLEYRVGHTLMTDLKYVTKWGPAQALE